MKITFSTENNATIITLPYVLADGYNIDYGTADSEEVSTIFGQMITSIGADPLAHVTISGEFPKKKQPWMDSETQEQPVYTEFFRKSKRDGIVLRLVMTRDNGETAFNRLVICASLQYKSPTVVGDIPYEMEFTEYRMASTSAVPILPKPKPKKTKKKPKKKSKKKSKKNKKK